MLIVISFYACVFILFFTDILLKCDLKILTMKTARSLAPARFLVFSAHLVFVITLFWSLVRILFFKIVFFACCCCVVQSHLVLVVVSLCGVMQAILS